MKDGVIILPIYGSAYICSKNTLVLPGQKKIELEIVAVSHSITQTHSYAVILGEINGLRRIPIVIGGFEAQAIVVAMEKMHPNRPLTHDLMKNFMLAFDVDLLEVVIYDLQEGVFYAQLVCVQNNNTVVIDSRTSDALALAARFGCPIYTYEHIIQNVQPDEKSSSSVTETTAIEKKNAKLEKMSVDELQRLQDEALEQEDYMRAAAIRDELKARGI